ncbi:MAG: sugar ABC transporter permease [Spirochaetaceae bacterium]|jgi:multiple sugar transport system permease protein|nr:sugar ABC transporter permease [Spirochaetaceae bacterium]
MRKNSVSYQNLKWGYIFIAPCIIGLLVFNLGPMLFSLMASFTEWDMITPMKFVGLKNFKQIFTTAIAAKSIQVTFYYALLSVPLITLCTFLTAILLNSSIKGISIFRTIIYIPSIVPIVASSALWLYIFNPMFGLLNSIARALSLPTSNYIFSPTGAVPWLSVMAVWMAGNTVVIYLAGLQGISKDLYEAADLDGANAFQSLIHITVPMMTPIIFYNMLMALISSMQTFTQVYMMTNGGPANATLFMSLYLYNEAFKYQHMGYASAVSWILFIFIAIITAVVFATSGNWVFYENAGSKKKKKKEALNNG